TRCWKRSGPPSLTPGTHCDDRTTDSLSGPVPGHRAAGGIRTGPDQRSAAGIHLPVSPFHVHRVDDRWHLFLAAMGATLALGAGHPASGAARPAAGIGAGAVFQRSRPWRTDVA